MSLYQTEFWGILCNIVLVFQLVFFIYLSYPVVKQNFASNHPSRWNLTLILCSLGIVALLIFLGVILPNTFDPLFYYPYNYYAVFGFFAWWIFSGIHIKFYEWVVKFTAKRRHLEIQDPKGSGDILYNQFQKFRKEHPESLKYDIEFQRKLVHIISILFLLPFLIGPTLYFVVYVYVYSPYPELYSPAILQNVYRSSWFESLDTAMFANIQTMLTALLIAVTIQFVGELFHNRAPDYFYPLRKSFLRCLREEELGTFGSHVAMTVGYLLCVVTIMYNVPSELYNNASNAIIATIFATIFGDMAASAIGRRWGKTKWRFNSRKSHLGSVAGMIITFAVTFPLIGWLGSAVAIVFFIITDVFLAKYGISDNYAFPVLCGFLLRILLPYLTLPIIIWNLF